MELKTFIFMGRSGSGKGTQAKLLIDEMVKRDSEHSVFYLETGKFFREYVSKEGHTNRIAKEIVEGGGRVNSFLAIWMWTNALIANLKGDEHLVIDGSPRAIQEAQIMDTAMTFYGRQNPVIVYINTSRTWCEERLLERHRNDDLTIEHIRKKLDWFESDVEGAIWWYRNQAQYKFMEINGEHTVDEVKDEIFAKVFNEN